MKKNWQLMMVLVVSAVALVFAFILKQPLIAQGLITVMGSIIALIMFGGMVKTIRSGNFGVDLLAITAVVATLAVSQYWGSDDCFADADWWGRLGKLCCDKSQQ